MGIGGPLLGRELIEASDVVILGRMRQEAELLLGKPLPDFDATSIVRLPSGLPIFYSGWLRRLRERQRQLQPAAITLAGDYLSCPSMEGAIRTGEQAADRILRWLAG
jgi:protoporphyrinogen oxidase